jgi:hypothetical protein
MHPIKITGKLIIDGEVSQTFNDKVFERKNTSS